MIDYHVHTMLCNHARGTMEQYIDHAVGSGLEEICFLEHLTLNESGRHLSLTPDELPLYYYSARRLQAACRGKINIKVGLEIDFIPELWDLAQTKAEQFDFDVIGASVHFIKNQNLVSPKTANKHKPDNSFYESYLDLLDAMLDCSFIDVICHIDVVKKFSAIPPGWFYERLQALIDKIAEKKKTLEINTSGLRHPVEEIYPRPDLLKQCRKKNIRVCPGSDAHLPEQVGRDFAHAETILKQAGYTSVTGFDRKTPYPIPI
ncbi:MAG: histidinol-phosphatase [Desulfobacteraceae bacterium]|nr:histidinol-phosphatase [Desulfobacteraceae bacterium]